MSLPAEESCLIVFKPAADTEIHTSRAGRYGGTYAHKHIAFEFASWVSVEFKLHLIKEFQRLKDEVNERHKLGWNLQRTLSYQSREAK